MVGTPLLTAFHPVAMDRSRLKAVHTVPMTKVQEPVIPKLDRSSFSFVSV